MNKKITKEEFKGICGDKYLSRHKNQNQEVLHQLNVYIDQEVPFDENGKIENGIDIEKFLDEFEKLCRN